MDLKPVLIQAAIEKDLHNLVNVISKIAGEQLAQHLEVDSIIEKAKQDIYNAFLWEIEYNARNGQTPVIGPRERAYNNGKLSEDLKSPLTPWITKKSRGLTYTIEPNTQNKVKEGYNYRIIIIDALAEVMSADTSDCLLHIYHYKTEDQANQDIEKLNTENPQDLYLNSL